MSIDNYIFKIIKSTLSKLKINQKKQNNNISTLNDNIIRFTYLSCAISNNNIEILTSKDNIGGYFENKLLLPTNITLSQNKNINILSYIYKIVFSLTSRKFNFYLPEDNKNLNYSFLATILTIKAIHKKMIYEFPNIKYIIEKLYFIINKKRTNIKHLYGKALLLEILYKKLSYQNIQIKLNQIDNYWIYQIENTSIYSQEQLKYNLKKTYKQLCINHPKNKKIELNQLWGYLYFKTKNINITVKKNTTNIDSKKTTKKNKNNVHIENIELEKNKKNNTPLDALFDYKKTLDKYKGGNKNISGEDENITDLSILDEMNIKQVTRSNVHTQSNFSSTILNNIFIPNVEKQEKNNIKKFLYKEWDYKNQKYNKNWCSTFVEKNKIIQNSNSEKTNIDKIIKEQQKHIILFRDKFNLILNIKEWKKRQRNGEDIDFDTLVDNYSHIKENSFNKLYKYKKSLTRDIIVSIIFDSSLSTDSYIKNKQIIDIIKDLAIFICCGINKLVTDFSLSTFYSNTRHDCKYIIIKNYKEKWQEKKYNITDVKPRGYTRIGPAIRHTAHILDKIKAKKKLMLLISDGKPTDYDEYEGKYGIMDVKHAIHEAKKNNIDVKSIITDIIPRTYFPSMFGIKNYQLINQENNSYIKILKLFYDIIKN